VYLVLHNKGASDRQILNLEASIAGRVEVHQHIHEDGVMKMRQVAHLQIPANGQVTFEPGGYHIMLFDVAESPSVGSQFTLTLEFDGGERLTFPVDVVSL
jgi:copper(I)-binding protein